MSSKGSKVLPENIDNLKDQLELPFLDVDNLNKNNCKEDIRILQETSILPALSHSESITPITISWPPNYTIRMSARSKRVTLSISSRKGLEVVIPSRLRRQPNILNLLNEKRSWVERNLKSILENKQNRPKEMTPPILLDLRAIHKMIHLSYESTPQRNIKIKPVPGVSDTYRIQGPIEQHSIVFAALNVLLKSLAKVHLVPWIFKISQETGLYYSAITIRSQSTLWGSCTRARKISLNNKLLFLPDYLTRYILVHELCHIQHLNHSKRFWSLVQKYDPMFKFHRHLIKKAGEYIPPWLEIGT